jgi:histidinol-phosphatase (PHP family)
MLTDYHVHLRPDEAGTPPEDYFTEANVARYRAAADSAGIAELGVAEHIHRFAQALDIWRHPFWVEQAVDDLDAYCEFLAVSGLKVGIEADFIAGAEERIRDLLSARSFDYVVGSVHFVGDSAVDQDRWDVWQAEGNDPDRVWARYFERLGEAARSGLFDTMAHPDLVKVWGPGRPGPERDPRSYYEPAVEAIAEAGVAVEISTAGLRKPIGEIYPSAEFAALCVEAGIPFTLSSDAHLPEEVGYAYGEAVEFMRELGIDQVCVFSSRTRALEPLG